MRVEKNVTYRDVAGDRQKLDVYLPAGPAPAGGRPVIVAIHGGGWRKFSKEEYEPIVAPFAKLGYIVVAPNYRLSAPRSPSWPTNFEDVRDSVRWVRSHATELGADPNRIAAMGESAGGHLAALLGTYPDGAVNPDGPAVGTSSAQVVSARVQAVVDFYGPTDLSALDARSAGASGPIRQFLGASPEQAPGRYASASPSSHVAATDPPFLIVHGSRDWLVNVSQSTGLADKLSSVGVPNRLEIIPGASHGFGLMVGGRNLLDEIDAFLSASMP
ncbi:MAG: esterase/lipase [Planctomycetota bacterium]|nr:esterase/lipase [Planctomycetota bacterium]